MSIEILPIEVVAQSFPARPSALPDVRDFMRRQLAVSDDDVRALCERVAEVLLDRAGEAGAIQVSLRMTPGVAEVDVLFAPLTRAETAGRVAVPVTAIKTEPVPVAVPAQRPGEPQQSFAVWFASRLRREGLTMEAAARKLEVSTKTVSRWVAGTTEPRLRDVYRIRETFGEPFH